jgi:hypothetical protein
MKLAPIALAIGVLAVTSAARAQPPVSPSAAGQPQKTALQRMHDSLVDELRERESPLSLVEDIDYIAVLAGQRGSLVRMLQEFEDQRSDEQVGATASSSGTTTVVSKGTVPSILGLAVENGAVTKDQSATVVTFRTNLGGAARTLAGKGYFQLSSASSSSLAILDAISLSASFDTSRGDSSGSSGTTTLTADRQQLSQWTARVQLINHRNPSNAAFLKAFQASVAPSLQKVASTTSALYPLLQADPSIAQWLTKSSAGIETARVTATAAPNATSASITQAISDALTEAEKTFPAEATLRSDTRAGLTDYDRAASVFAGDRQGVLDKLAGAALLALEWSNDRPALGPNTSNSRLAGEIGTQPDLTWNTSLTLFDPYNALPTGVTHRVRDLQLSAEMDVRLGNYADPTFILSLSGKYLHQYENSFDPTTGLMIQNTTGNTGIAQLKLTIPAGKGTGAKIPLSITYANRTELIQESVVRANVGITYDLDSLFARVKP